MEALTEANIKSVFAKTGIWPFNPGVVTPKMMALGKETSTQGSLPVPESMPVCTVSDMILGIDEHSRKRAAELSPPVTPSSQWVNQQPQVEPSTPTTVWLHDVPDPFQIPVRNRVSALQGSSVSFLLTRSPIRTSSATLPEFPTIQFSPMASATLNPALDDPLATIRKEELLCTYHTLQQKYKSLKTKAVSLQSAMVLNSVCCDCLRKHLAAQDEAKKWTKSNKRLMGAVCPRKRSGNEKRGRKGYEGLVAQRQKENKHAYNLWIADLELWKEEKKKGKTTCPKPLYKHFKLPPVPKPVILQHKPKEARLSESQEAEEDIVDGCMSDVSGSSGGSDSDSD
ncbi:hypothetical protein AAF712_014489 [Marasmius tenuissimus]|uniref:Uncharacterized protein n=1 Tax=Marasmius tenuissimus TaxID=585030 RepID=A0ABR2ZAX8_9AGAR